MNRSIVAALSVVLCAASAASAVAADHPVSGKQLMLRDRNGKGSLTLTLKDTAIPVPSLGTTDDPSLHGLTVTLFSRASEQQATFQAAPGGWRTKVTPTAVTYTYADRAATGGALSGVSLRTRAALKIRARSAGLDLDGPQGAIAVRVEYGSVRVCALFDYPAVTKDTAGYFSARNADAVGLANCDDDTLARVPCAESASCGGVCPGDAECGTHPAFPECVCVSPHQPCGDSAPVCNGECPDGEVCGSVSGGPETSCGCLPTQSTPCGELGAASCEGGACPAGKSCFVETFTIAGQSIDYCACRTEPQEPPCGGTCPEGWTCVGPVPGQGAFCMPPECPCWSNASLDAAFPPGFFDQAGRGGAVCSGPGGEPALMAADTCSFQSGSGAFTNLPRGGAIVLPASCSFVPDGDPGNGGQCSTSPTVLSVTPAQRDGCIFRMHLSAAHRAACQ